MATPVLPAQDTEPPPEVGIVEQLGEIVPLDLSFKDSEGKEVTLGELIDKPTVLSLVYFHCPSVCMPLLGGNTGRTSPYGFHDWEFILKETGLIQYDHTFAALAHYVGKGVILCALLWGGYILFKQFQNLNLRN